MLRGTHLILIVSLFVALSVASCDQNSGQKNTPTPTAGLMHTGTGSFIISTDASSMMVKNDIAATMLERNLQLLQYDTKGKPALVQLIHDLDLNKGMPVDDDGELTVEGKEAHVTLVAQLQASIKVEIKVESPHLKMIQVSVTYPDQTMVAPIVNRVMENYIKHLRKELNDELVLTKTFFEAERNRFQALLKQLHILQIRFNVELISVPEFPKAFENPVLLHDRLYELKLKNAKVKTEADELIAKTKSLMKWEAVQSEFKRNRKLLDDGTYEIEEVPNVQKIEAQKQIQEGVAKHHALVYECESLDKLIVEYEVMVKRFYDLREEYMNLNRDAKHASDSLEFWENKLREAQMALTLQAGERGVHMRIFERCPVSPAATP